MNDETPDTEAQTVDILWQDEETAAVVKPSGMLTHNSSYAGPPEIALLQVARDTLKRHIYMIQRLDRGTSGLLLVCYNPQHVEPWKNAILAGRKDYLCIVRGRMLEPVTIDKPLKDHGGTEREAVTHIMPLAQGVEDRVSLVRCSLQHGRNHQVRRHLNRANHPVLNDSEHGDTRFNRVFRETWTLSRLMLHAECLELIHPFTDEPLRLHCPLPGPMGALAEQLFPGALSEKS